MEEEHYRLKTVKQVLEYYMENRGYFAEKWSDLAHMTSVFVTVMGNRKIKDLRPEHFIAYNSGRKRGAFGKRQAKSTGTVRRELEHLRAAVNFCVKARVFNPAHVPHIVMPPPSPPRDRWLNKKELEAIMRVADHGKIQPRVRTFIYLARYTAARKSAITHLKWDQVNFAAGLIEYAKHDKKKTKKRKATVPIHPELRVYLEKIKASAQNEYVLEHKGDIRAGLDAAANQAGIDGLTPHVFRHTWATHASMNGVSMTDIARILGDTVATVEKVYAKFQPDYLKNAIEQAVL